MRVSSPDRVIFPATDAHAPRSRSCEVAEYYLAVGDGIMRALRERPTTLERWPKGVHEGMTMLDPRGPQGRRLLPEAHAQGSA